KFVHCKNSAVGAGQQAIVNGELIAQGAPRAGRLDGVHVAEDVGDGDVGRREFFDKARIARKPSDGCGVTTLGNQVAARAADRRLWIVVNFATGDVGNFHVQEIDQPAQDAALGLAPQTEKNEIVAREDRVGDLRQNSLFVTVNAGEERLS